MRILEICCYCNIYVYIIIIMYSFVYHFWLRLFKLFIWSYITNISNKISFTFKKTCYRLPLTIFESNLRLLGLSNSWEPPHYGSLQGYSYSCILRLIYKLRFHLHLFIFFNLNYNLEICINVKIISSLFWNFSCFIDSIDSTVPRMTSPQFLFSFVDTRDNVFRIQRVEI